MFSLPLKLGVVAMVMGYVIVVHRWVCPGLQCQVWWEVASDTSPTPPSLS